MIRRIMCNASLKIINTNGLQIRLIKPVIITNLVKFNEILNYITFVLHSTY